MIGNICITVLKNNSCRILYAKLFSFAKIKFSSVVGSTIKTVPIKKPFPSKAALILTDAAIKRIKELVKFRPDTLGLKIGVRERGCNGLSYTLDYAHEKGKFDEEVRQCGIVIFIDRKAQLTLLGTQMDYVENKLSSEFIFHNPNIKGTCGCGESFNI